MGVVCEIVDLAIKEMETEEACVLVIRNFVGEMLGDDTLPGLAAEMDGLTWDTKALMRGRVVNKIARHNVCFDDDEQEPDYEGGKGRIVAFRDVPTLAMIRFLLPEWFGRKAADLKAEGNLYYDAEKCHIGFHGDAERKRVIALRVGDGMTLRYQWYCKSEAVGPRFDIELGSSDGYCMCEKASGSDWRLRNTPTLRHAAGTQKALKL